MEGLLFKRVQNKDWFIFNQWNVNCGLLYASSTQLYTCIYSFGWGGGGWEIFVSYITIFTSSLKKLDFSIRHWWFFFSGWCYTILERGKRKRSDIQCVFEKSDIPHFVWRKYMYLIEGLSFFLKSELLK